MKKTALLLAIIFLFTNAFSVGAFAAYSVPSQPDSAPSDSFIIPDESTGKLNYYPYDDKGSKLADFSYAGFYGGEYELPETFRASSSYSMKIAETVYPVKWTAAQIEAGTADDAKRINEAIDSAAKKLEDGELGKNIKLAIVKLAPGTYYIPKNTSGSGVGSVNLKSNIILSGSGQGPTGTNLYAYQTTKLSNVEEEEAWGKAYRVIGISGSNNPAGISANIVNITEQYIEAGSNTFTVSSTDKLAVGDLIRITFPRSDAWSTDLGMDGPTCIEGGAATGWNSATNATVKRSSGSGNKTKLDVKMERTITAINGNEITIDIPFFTHADKAFEDPEYPFQVMEITSENRLYNIGIENLRIESNYDTTDSYPDGHAGVGVSIYRAKNVYIQNVTFKHLQHSAVFCNDNSKGITVRGCSSLEPKGRTDGGYRYTFGMGANTQQIFVTGSYSHAGRHDFEASYTATGPIAFVDNVVDEALASSETHGTWSTGLLYDNLIQIGDANSSNKIGYIATANRGRYGTSLSQGWTGAGVVIWNSLSPLILAHDVKGDYQNFIFGIWGRYTLNSSGNSYNNRRISDQKNVYYSDYGMPADAFKTYANSPIVGDATVISPEAPVEPRSLYKAQLAERITGNFKNAKANAPVIHYPKPDYKVSSSDVTISGMYEKGATKVNVYIDDVKYDATLTSSNNSFVVNAKLENGTHKIYATQVIDGKEGCKTPDRFVIVGSIGENQSYLSSEYSNELLSLINNDDRMSFDEYLDSYVYERLPKDLGSYSEYKIFGSVDEGESMTVKNQNGEDEEITGKYLILPARVIAKKGHKTPKFNYGFYISTDGNTYYPYKSQMELKGDAYGILLYNLGARKYWFKQFTSYIDPNGVTNTVFGKPFTITIK